MQCQRSEFCWPQLSNPGRRLTVSAAIVMPNPTSILMLGSLILVKRIEPFRIFVSRAMASMTRIAAAASSPS